MLGTRDPGRWTGLVAGLALLVSSCFSAPTEVLVVVDTDAPSGRTVTLTVTVSARVASDAGHLWQRRADGGGLVLPGSFAVLPAPGMALDEETTLTLHMSVGPGSHGEPPVDFDRVARFRFTPHATWTLRIFLAMACGGRSNECTRVPLSDCTVAEHCAEQNATCDDRGMCAAPTVIPPQDAGSDAADMTVNDVCVRRCAGRMCGPDGCGGSCGACGSGASCNASGQCVGCMPDCSGRACGPDPSCGSSCGSCGGGHSCDGSGQCVCGSGTVDCGGTCVDTSSDGANCGSCGHNCGSGEACGGGTCNCRSGYVRVAGTCLPSCGVALAEAHLDNAGLGCCGSPCTTTEVGPTFDCTHCCSSTGPGACACPGSQMMCGGACVDTATDPNNCGSCGNHCASGMCSGGVCGCPAGQMRCSGTCVFTDFDPSNCGGCGSTCPAGAPDCCYAGCTDMQFDPNNCGSCGNNCGGFSCFNGMCQ